MSASPERLFARRATVSWCLFDFANSSFTTLIITVAFAVYFRDVVVNAPDNRADQYWGIANFVAMLLVAMVSPVTGAVADYSGRKKFFLIATSLVTIGATALLYLVDAGQIGLAATLYVVGLTCFELGYVFYNSFLPEVSTPETIGKVSGWGWAIGYAGGLACLGACYPLVGKPLKDAAGNVLSSGVTAYQLSFLLVAVFYLVFAMPAFLWLRERPVVAKPGWAECARRGFARVVETLRHLRSYRDVGWLVAASLFFTDGITTIVSFAGIYATTTMRFTNQELVVFFLVLNVVAFPGSLAAGYLADRVGGKRTIIGTLVLWMAVAGLAAGATTKAAFWVMAVGAALGMGATQAVARSFMAQMTPPDRESEFFGFYALSGKFASMFGPLVFGSVSLWTGSQRLAVLSLFPFFAAAMVCMFRIDERRGKVSAGRDGYTIER